MEKWQLFSGNFQSDGRDPVSNAGSDEVTWVSYVKLHVDIL